MIFDVIQNTADKELSLEKVCEQLLNCNDKIKRLKEHYVRLQIDFPIHSSANFRDSFIHYEKLYDTLLSVEFECQKHAFEEHLQRCIKDSCVLLANWYLWILNNILVSSNLDISGIQDFADKCRESENECGFIFQDCPELKSDGKLWSVINLNNVCNELCKEFFEVHNGRFTDNEYTREYYCTYVKSCLLRYYHCNGFRWFTEDEIREIRTLVHRLNNHVLEIRLESCDLVKSYQAGENDSFSDFLDISNDIFDFIKKHFLLGIFFFKDIAVI